MVAVMEEANDTLATLSTARRAELLEVLTSTSRVALLAHLKQTGHASITERQAIANAIGRMQRMQRGGALGAAATSLAASDDANLKATTPLASSDDAKLKAAAKQRPANKEPPAGADRDRGKQVPRASGSLSQELKRSHGIDTCPDVSVTTGVAVVGAARIDVSEATSMTAGAVATTPGPTLDAGLLPVSDEERALRRFDEFHREHAWKVLAPVEAVYGISDLHADATQNMNVLLAMPPQPNAALVIAGDAATDLAVLERVITTLVGKFRHVCYVAGNHELWSNRRRTAPQPMWDGQWMKVRACWEARRWAETPRRRRAT